MELSARPKQKENGKESLYQQKLVNCLQINAQKEENKGRTISKVMGRGLFQLPGIFFFLFTPSACGGIFGGVKSLERIFLGEGWGYSTVALLIVTRAT